MRWDDLLSGLGRQISTLDFRRVAGMPLGLALVLALQTPPGKDPLAPRITQATRQFQNDDEPAEAPDDATLAWWRAFALNALLVPLLDDTSPPHWAPPMVVTPCTETASVTLDGRPLVAGERVPAGPFTLRWQLADCAPLDSSFWLRGHLTMQLEVEAKRVSATIASDDLVVTATDGKHHRAEQPFTAILALE